MAEPLAWLVDGEDTSLVGNEVRRLVGELAGDHADLSVEDFWGDDVDFDAVASACVTPPFLVDRRVVVLRDAGRFSTEELAPLLAYLDDPMATTALVVAAGGGRLAPEAGRRGQEGGPGHLDRGRAGRSGVDRKPAAAVAAACRAGGPGGHGRAPGSGSGPAPDPDRHVDRGSRGGRVDRPRRPGSLSGGGRDGGAVGYDRRHRPG